MDQRHAEYIAYYEARMKKYENQPAYKRCYEAEKKMAEAIKSCARLEDFRAVIEREHPEVRCAIALVEDQEAARLESYRKMDEIIRALAPERILKEIGSARTAMEVAQISSRIEQEVSLLITVDLLMSDFYADFKVLEDLEEAQAIASDIPDEWKEENKKFVSETLEHGRQQYVERLKNNRNYKADWDFDYGVIWEIRHRRGIPFPDEVVKLRIDQHKQYCGQG